MNNLQRFYWVNQITTSSMRTWLIINHHVVRNQWVDKSSMVSMRAWCWYIGAAWQWYCVMAGSCLHQWGPDIDWHIIMSTGDSELMRQHWFRHWRRICTMHTSACSVCKNTISVLFADDTNLFSNGVDATGLEDGVNYDLAVITKWLKVNKLSLNIKKTHYMCFTTKNK